MLFPWLPTFSCGLVIIAALGKEAKDIAGIPWLKERWPTAPVWLVDKGTPEVKDVLFTFAGWLAMVGLVVSFREVWPW